MFEIEITGEFSAAHALLLYDGTYEPRHGHLWKVAVTFRSQELDRIGVVHDFEALKPAFQKAMDAYEGYFLNDHADFTDKKLNSSTENLAYCLCERFMTLLPEQAANTLYKLTVWETHEGSATYYPRKKAVSA